MVVFGEDELAKGVVKVKNMLTKTEVEINADDVPRYSRRDSSIMTDKTCELVKYLRSEGCISIHADTELKFGDYNV